jgi:hypothetical protein
MLSTGSFNFIPYSLSGLQNITADTINGQTPFNGVIANANYPLSYNSTTGILSQTPIGQMVDISSTPTFQRITLTNTPSITTASGRLEFRPASFTTRFNNDGTHGFVEIECVGTSTTGQVLFYLPNGTLQALMRADTSYFYFFNLNALAGCVYYTKGGVVFYCSYGQATGTGEIVFKDNNIEVFTANAVNGLTMKNSNRIQSASGTNLILNAPTGRTINFNINNITISSVNSSGLTVNNISSDSSNDLSLSSANNNVNITALSTIGGTGAGNVNINFQRYLSFLNNSVEVARIDQASGRLIFTNLGSTTNTPIQFSGTGINYINTGSGTVGLKAGNNNFTVSTTDIQANINATNILKINSTGLIVNNITSNTSTNLILNGDLGIDFNVNGITYGQITSTGLLINNINSIGGQDLFLSSITGIIKTGSSLNMNGGNLNLFDYSTGLIQSQLYTDTTGLIISAPSTKDMRFKIGTNSIMTIASAGVSIQSLFTNGLTSNAFNNLVFDTPSGQTINFNIGSYNIGYINSSALIFNNISSDLTTSSNLNLNAPTSQTINFNINNSASVIVDNTGLSSSNSSFFIKNSNSLRDVVLQAGGGVSVCNFAGTYITRFNVFGRQIYLPYFSSGYYAIDMQTSTVGSYYLHYINGTTYQIINAVGVGVQLTYGGTSWGSVSDIRLKKNIQPLKNSLDLINKLNPITYNWKDETLQNNNIGFVAQEVQEVIPEITEDYDIKGEKYLGIRTTDLIPFLVKSIQEQSALFEEQKVQLLNQNKILVELSKELKDMNHFVSNICQEMTNMKAILKNHNLI